MGRKVWIGDPRKMTQKDCEYFSNDRHRCVRLLKDRNKQLVILSKRLHQKPELWCVAYGTCNLWFESYEEALSYCNKRFTPLDER